jgi:replicative DNA helicase
MVEATDQKLQIRDKLPPQSIESEMSLLGGVMLDKEAIIKVADLVEPRDFYKPAHQVIYEAMLDLFVKNDPVDLLSVSGRLKEKEKITEIGGRAYLTELINTVPTAAHVLSYAKTVQNKRILRDLISTSYEISEMGYNEVEDPNVLVDQAEQKIFSIAQKSLSHNFEPLKQGLEEAFERLDRLSKHEQATRGVPSGFVDLDNLLSGFQKSDLVILAARPSLGKSALALDIAKRVAVQEKLPVGFFSLEMSKDQLIDRMISSEGRVDSWRLRTGKLSSQGADNDFVRIQEALGVLSEAPIYIDDTASQTVLRMRAMARRLQASHGLGLIIIDYLQLIMPSSSQTNIVQQVTETSRQLKGLARELEVPVIALSQLSRAVEQRFPPRPRLSDLRESGSLEQDADVVMFIYREDKYKKQEEEQNVGNIAEIIVAKHRNGPIGSVKLFFNPDVVSFTDLAKDMQYDEGSSEAVVDF